ncbi:hypothetical protein ASPWEDRAFT_43820 [Aspergillus wentii DTO 134E9]|uniref:Uncharacterized protein n=1 Tax=Aspergillus wentii DTO 134E9 TaxID=1073089 RepID=A0A1L9RAC4_ASPWE|nr:uncharacterized protein ASPWEDRAFT_43820 [Aspergillus wentii DTO 134E9]OJJ31823.1 hypothetical protein ASPWEDRAFT_43820 [Aspergillus wentii DTO 134E9]
MEWFGVWVVCSPSFSEVSPVPGITEWMKGSRMISDTVCHDFHEEELSEDRTLCVSPMPPSRLSDSRENVYPPCIGTKQQADWARQGITCGWQMDTADPPARLFFPQSRFGLILIVILMGIGVVVILLC